MTTRTGRAEPLAPHERRRAIVEAVIPLLIEHGASVTTRQMAEAAGIAEGTIFRVFPDKHALIHEAIRFSMDPAPIEKGLAEIYQRAPIEVQLAEAGRILLERMEGTIALLSVVRMMPSFGSRVSGPPPFVVEANAVIAKSLTGLFERHRDRLRIEPARAATAFWGLVFASGHPIVSRADRLTVDELVGVLLSGIVDPVEQPA
jgi:AcrR family transcriptional regulator